MTAAPACTYGFTLFDTAIGPCGLAWGPAGVIGAQLPEPSMAASRARLARRFPQAREAPPPPSIASARDDIIALLAGEPRDLADIPLDMSEVPPFHQRVYAVARAIPPGATFTYGEIAARIGEPGAARAVGQALGRNPFPIIVPCHRVLAAGGRTGGFSARGGVATKMRMLTVEGARLAGAPTLFDADPAFARLGAAARRNPR
jgi:methylated-DNA-[protein]-cysteine S-methyltransferase